ncbi:NAD(P)-binding protein [Periconia macrospinosa]|uniref:NAD(P)-binding protein n=1 Tax=Periconia macrospinosa TaxID=97972 RepID=A0A2V1E924_9PLEO|nr:NAD(P)-binding protein [Periconia macrospinosa]
MGTGGVSCFGIQFASALGATVIATSSSSAKLETAKKLGATHVINYTTTPDWDVEVLRLTKGKGVDQVLEVGGAATLLKSIKCTRPGGLVSLIGILGGAETLPEEVVPSVLFGGKIVKGCVAFNKIAIEDMVKFVRANGIKPLVSKRFAFEEAVEAFEFLQRGGAVGNVVIRWPKE